MNSVRQEIEGTGYQTLIKALLGRVITRAEALEALRLHEEVGDGGNTIGWKFDRLINGEFKLSSKAHTIVGDNIIDLGRLANANTELKWCFPESYKTNNFIDGSSALKYISI